MPEQGLEDSARRQIEAARASARERDLELDESLRDEGVSAFHGRNLLGDRALAGFVRAVEAGRVEDGAWLIVEALDRITRRNPWKASPA